MINRVQIQFILSRGDFYKEYIDSIPKNYIEIIPYFNDMREEPDVLINEQHEDSHPAEDSEPDNWSHFRKDLSQYPFLQAVWLKNNKGDIIWFYNDTMSSDEISEGPVLNRGFQNNLISYEIISKFPDLVINYYISVIYKNHIIGTAVVQIKDSTLKESIRSSRKRFAILIFCSGLIFYISLFLLFYKVYYNQKKALNHLDQSQTLTIRTMSLLAELKDNDTGEHIQRTSEYCRIIAQNLKENSDYKEYITDDYIKDLERSAPLHDIGKVGIPESILLKPGKLTDEEFNIIKKHPELGAKVLETATESLEFRSFFKIGYQIVLHHHENWDGSGYPHGLKEQDIPLSARIMAIADVYDALTSKRPYKKAFSHEEAMKIIIKEKGKKFDPKLIDSFLNVEKEFKQVSVDAL